MRWVVVTSLVSGLLLSSLPVAAAPHRLDSGAPDYPSAAWQEDDLAIRSSGAIDDAGADPDPDAGVPVDAAARPVEPSSSSSSSGSTRRPEKPVELPSNYGYQGSSTSTPVYYYEGDSCSGASGGYYEEDDSDSCSGDTYESSGGGDSVVIFTGDDDDDDDDVPPIVTGDDDDDDDDTPIEWGDDDDDDDDDDSTTTTQSVKVTSASIRAKGVRAAPAPGRSSSPVSRLALLGALIVFPLRRRGRKTSGSARAIRPSNPPPR